VVSAVIALGCWASAQSTAAAQGEMEPEPLFCPEHLVEVCNTHCRKTCNDPKGHLKICDKKCHRGCGCKDPEDFYDEKLERCVKKKKECGVMPKCPPGQVYKSCWACLETCEMGHICARGCLASGCRCPSGTYSHAATGSCLPNFDACLNDTPLSVERKDCPKPLVRRRGKTCKNCDVFCTLAQKKAQVPEMGCFCPRSAPVLHMKPDGSISCLTWYRKCPNWPFLDKA